MSTTTTTTRKTASIMNLASLVTSNGPDSSPIPRLQTTTNAAALTPKPLSRTYDQYCERETPTSPDYSTSFGMNATPASTSVASISPQTPLSPPAEEQRKWSLPSISSLLEGAAADAALPSAKRLRLSSEPRAPLQSTDLNIMKGSRIVLPPTPPLRPGSGFSESKRSPTALSPPDSAISPTSISPSSNPIKNPESFQQQQQQQQRSRSQSQSQTPTLASLVSAASAVPAERASASQDSHTQSRFSGPTYPSPAPTISSYTSPVEPSPSPVIYYQRPTPASSFQASRNVPASVAPSASSSQLISPVNPAWQHHHYFPPSASPPYPQNHDRYVCRTCHKAFSRPSSLRIHSHSHTGEKPFRCTHVGCGKAFSVRSNMKRHERGCHTGRPVAATLV